MNTLTGKRGARESDWTGAMGVLPGRVMAFPFALHVIGYLVS